MVWLKAELWENRAGAPCVFTSSGMADTIDCNWHRSRFPCISEASDPRNPGHTRHSLPIENGAEALARVARQVSEREKYPRPQGTGPGSGKGWHWWPMDLDRQPFAVGRHWSSLSAVGAGGVGRLSFGCNMLCRLSFGTNTCLPKPAYASQ